MADVYKGNNSVVWSNPDDDEAFALTTGLNYSTPESAVASLPKTSNSISNPVSSTRGGIDRRAWGQYKGDKLALNYGLTSREDVAAFQRKYGLTADGLLGNNSIAKLEELISNNSSDIMWDRDRNAMMYNVINKGLPKKTVQKGTVVKSSTRVPNTMRYNGMMYTVGTNGVDNNGIFDTAYVYNGKTWDQVKDTNLNRLMVDQYKAEQLRLRGNR